MIGKVTYTPGVQFTTIAPAGHRLIDALKYVARQREITLVITCACEGHHPTDPHSLGMAYDVRSHDFTNDQKTTILREIMLALQRGDLDAPIETSGGLATMYFFGWLEHPGEPAEHFHFQRRKGTTYGIDDYLAA